MVPAIPISGEWFRCVSLRRDPLSFEGARLTGGRFSPVGEPALYLAGTSTLAVAENLRLANLYGVGRFPPRLLVTVEVTLSRIVDLRSEEVRRVAGIASEDLASEWRCVSGSSRSQLLGIQLIAEEYEGAIFPSAIEADAANLVVFARNVDLGRALHVVGSD